MAAREQSRPVYGRKRPREGCEAQAWARKSQWNLTAPVEGANFPEIIPVLVALEGHSGHLVRAIGRSLPFPHSSPPHRRRAVRD